MSAYYNEFEPYAAQWLRNLIIAGLIAPGDVDTRSIVDVAADDVRGYQQCHFFAGIGGWSLAARLAGWPDGRQLWTGSAPCQPFSVAGKGKAQGDDRHLWPHYFRLIAAARPDVCMGEQVAAAVGKDWLDGVFADLEGIGYACGATVVPACAVNAPHRRDRLWFVADADVSGLEGRESVRERAGELSAGSSGLADSDSVACGQGDSHAGRSKNGSRAREVAGLECSSDGSVGNASSSVCEWQPGRLPAPQAGVGGTHRQLDGHLPVGLEHAGEGAMADTDIACDSEERQQRSRQLCGAGSDPWARHSWIVGHDGKARRVEPDIRLLAHGVSNRVGRLRAYGNAIVPQVAAEVIGAYMDCRP